MADGAVAAEVSDVCWERARCVQLVPLVPPDQRWKQSGTAASRSSQLRRGPRTKSILSTRGEDELVFIARGRAHLKRICARSSAHLARRRTLRKEKGEVPSQNRHLKNCARSSATDAGLRRRRGGGRDLRRSTQVERRAVGSRGRRLKEPEQAQFAFPNGWGGRRKGAGPKPRGERAGVSHRERAPLASRFPVAVTLRVKAGLPSLRDLREFAAVRGAIVAGCERAGFRLVHFSVQSNHVHLLAEGSCRSSLSRGMQGLAIRMARGLNRLWRRFGRVFADRYHDRILRSPLEVWNALRYVLCNARKHGAWTSRTRPDPLTSSAWFDGWRESLPAPAESAPTAPARTWLLRIGWRLHGLLRVDATPRVDRPTRCAVLQKHAR